MKTCRYGHLEVGEFLFKTGLVDIDDASYYGRTALMYASEYGHLDLVVFLVENGAKIYTNDNYGNTAMSDASKNGHKEIVEYLKSKGAIE